MKVNIYCREERNKNKLQVLKFWQIPEISQNLEEKTPILYY